MSEWELKRTEAIGLPAGPLLEVRERFTPASVLLEMLIVAAGLSVFSLISVPAATFLGLAVAVRLAWMVMHRRRLVWDGRDVWLTTGRSRTHATRGGTGEIRQFAVRRPASPGTTVTHHHSVIVNEAGSVTVRLPTRQWDPAELAALATAAAVAFTDYGLISAADAAIVDPSPSDWTGLMALGVFAIAMAIAWFTPR